MNAIAILSRHARAAKMRVAIDTAAIGLPIILVAVALTWRLAGTLAAAGIGILGLATIAAFAFRRVRQFDSPWLVRQLDARIPAFEDSSALLLSDVSAAGGFGGLQRRRIEARIAQADMVDFRPPWSRRAIVAAWGVGALLIAAVLLRPTQSETPPTNPRAGAAPSPAGPPRITATSIRIVPPAYTGLPVRVQQSLDVRAPEGSRIEWAIDFAPAPSAATIAFPGQASVPMTRSGARWTATYRADRPMLYRVEAQGMARQRLRRLETIADTPPVVRVEAPDSQLAMVTPGQRRWTPVFEATDDYGVSASALLRITVTQGDGENITFLQRTTPIAGSGSARRKRFTASLDLLREGMAPGSDLIAQIVVTDNRSPGAQRVEGPSVILRWPADLALADGLDGMAAPVMPAYFRSQRQIIIDAEALIAQRRRIGANQFAERSNALGGDQAQLRMRYGQFMGEDAEGGVIALPTNDAPALPTNDAPPPPAEAHSPGDGHDHGSETAAPGFGSPVDVLNEYGHAHDSGDAATLFDPGTRSTLSLALDAMWSSERALRQGEPQAALPFAYRALEFLKEAQQATRIFASRTGAEMPPIDMTRRMSGDREGIVADRLVAAKRDPADTIAADAWRALGEQPGGRTTPLSLGALDRWLRLNRTRVANPLALGAAIDTVRSEPACAECRARLRALLWRVMERPSAAIRRRDAAGARGRRYLDALR